MRCMCHWDCLESAAGGPDGLMSRVACIRYPWLILVLGHKGESIQINPALCIMGSDVKRRRDNGLI